MKSIQPFTPYTLLREWGEEIIIAETPLYLGKILSYEAGKAGGLQAHGLKDESFHLVSGLAVVEYDDGSGTLVATTMRPGDTFHIPPGAPHRFIASEDCVVFEVSNPIHNDRIRLEDTYGVSVIGDGPGLPTTTELPS